MDLNLVSASCLDTELDHEAAQRSVVNGGDTTGMCSVVALDCEAGKPGGGGGAQTVHLDQQDNKAATQYVATQSEAQVASPSSQFDSVLPSEQRHMPNSSVPDAPERHAPPIQGVHNNTNNDLTGAAQNIKLGQMATAFGQDIQVPQGKGQSTHVPDGPPGNGKPFSAQPSTLSCLKSVARKHTQCLRQSDATTQTPPRQQPKRKLLRKDSASDSAPVPFARRKLECSPRQVAGPYSAAPAAWSCSPADHKATLSPSMLAWTSNREAGGSYNPSPGVLSTLASGMLLAFQICA